MINSDLWHLPAALISALGLQEGKSVYVLPGEFPTGWVIPQGEGEVEYTRRIATKKIELIQGQIRLCELFGIKWNPIQLV